MKSVLPEVESEKSDTFIYLCLFERKAQKTHIERNQLFANLLGLLPIELGELILMEMS